jgi:phage head maturation protease
MSTTVIHTRAAAGAGTPVRGVDWPARLITVIAVPWNQPAVVNHRGQTWTELFRPGAFNNLDNIDPDTIRVNREHNRADAIGEVVSFDPYDPRGLIAVIRVVRTARGDDTLGLAAEDCLSARVGFGVHHGGEILDRFTRTRTITRAFLDHLALVQAAAYDGAQVLGVRSAVDRYLADPVIVWAQLRTDPVMQWARHGARRWVS